MGQIAAEAWEHALALSAYSFEPMTLAWHRGNAYVRLWNWKTGKMEWRRFPARDVTCGAEPKPKPRPFDAWAFLR